MSFLYCLQRDYCSRSMFGERITDSRFTGWRVDCMGPKVSWDASYNWRTHRFADSHVCHLFRPNTKYKYDLMCHLIHFLCAGTVQSVKFVKKGEHCLSTGLDGSLRKWSLLTGKQLFSIPAVVSVQPWPTEQIIVLEPKAMVLSNTQGQVRQLST